MCRNFTFCQEAWVIKTKDVKFKILIAFFLAFGFELLFALYPHQKPIFSTAFFI
jgi:hypothetical protein